MSGNPPALRIEALRIVRAGTEAESRPEELTDIEKLIFPTWLDHDSTTGGPNYLGYAMLLMPVALLAMLSVCAIAVVV